MGNNFDWMTDPLYLSQMGHALAGALIILVASVFLGITGMWIVFGVGVVLAGVKEFWFDLKYETSPKQTFADSLLDFAFYLIGGGIGLGISYLAESMHRIS